MTNKFLTFSTHPLMPGIAAPGQLYADEVSICIRFFKLYLISLNFT